MIMLPKLRKKHFKDNITLREAALKLKLVTEKEFDKLLIQKK